MLLANWLLDRLATADKCMIFIHFPYFLLRQSISIPLHGRLEFAIIYLLYDSL